MLAILPTACWNTEAPLLLVQDPKVELTVKALSYT